MNQNIVFINNVGYLSIVIVREDLLGHALICWPGIFHWKITSDNGSNWNTPPCFQ